MSAVPGHYRAFRLALGVLAIGLLAGAGWYLGGHVTEIARLVGLGG